MRHAAAGPVAQVHSLDAAAKHAAASAKALAAMILPRVATGCRLRKNGGMARAHAAVCGLGAVRYQSRIGAG
ncbi:protein of unknown function [Paraburkholderia kururiensis]